MPKLVVSAIGVELTRGCLTFFEPIAMPSHKLPMVSIRTRVEPKTSSKGITPSGNDHKLVNRFLYIWWAEIRAQASDAAYVGDVAYAARRSSLQRCASAKMSDSMTAIGNSLARLNHVPPVG